MGTELKELFITSGCSNSCINYKCSSSRQIVHTHTEDALVLSCSYILEPHWSSLEAITEMCVVVVNWRITYSNQSKSNTHGTLSFLATISVVILASMRRVVCQLVMVAFYHPCPFDCKTQLRPHRQLQSSTSINNFPPKYKFPFSFHILTWSILTPARLGSSVSE